MRSSRPLVNTIQSAIPAHSKELSPAGNAVGMVLNGLDSFRTAVARVWIPSRGKEELWRYEIVLSGTILMIVVLVSPELESLF